MYNLLHYHVNTEQLRSDIDSITDSLHRLKHTTEQLGEHIQYADKQLSARWEEQLKAVNQHFAPLWDTYGTLTQEYGTYRLQFV